MDLLSVLIAVLLIAAFYIFLTRGKEENSKISTVESLGIGDYKNKKYKLYVMPTVFTSLRALRMREKVFDSEEEIYKLDLKQSEAHSNLFMPEFDYHDSNKTWTDGGYVFSKEQLDEYYSFLERVRTIFENETYSADDRIEKIYSLCKQNNKYEKFLNNLNEYYKAFPECLFYKDLTVVDGVGDKTAYTLFNFGIKTLNELVNSSDEELNRIPGIGKKTITQIRNYFKT
jgi:NAD-dependent DNA ligase